MSMVVVHTNAACRAERAKLGRLAFVPTMGALHAGHVSLIDAARTRAPHTAVSLFVNPTQFGPTEDFSKYPRTLESDLAKCREAGVDLVFNPPPEEMYRPGAADATVDVPSLTSVLEGKHRQGHFKGVCQVVAKLFNIVRPDVALFGQKDFQQFRVLSAMAEALDFTTEMVACPTLREADGLAMSSRNRYLSPEDRQRALCISRGLFAAEAEYRKGIVQTNRLVATIQKIILEQHVNIDYVAAVDPISLKSVYLMAGPTVLAVAARVGNTRLIDNVVLT
jgi:pantoate--beta-alanine ligase